jgi:tetratricopeptide (TPR) repeat protein
MKGLFQRRAAGGDSGTARLTLGAFGKHPGWDDHILGIGVETDTLAQLKQTLYVRGIGSQVDSGAWEKLEPDRRLVGYDHTFLALRPGHVFLGQLWSSADGKGRAKYPMVLCIDGESISPAFALNVLLPGLERLRAACKSTNSAEQVASDCRSGQDQLRAVLARETSRLFEPGPTVEARRGFLENPKMGPDRLGFLRAMHELAAVPGVGTEDRTPGAARALPSAHLRLPLGADTTKESLQLWMALFRCIVPETAPLFLVARAGESWLDVLISEPAPDAFFCLQASPKALPWTTEIPYALAPELKTRWALIEAKFLGSSASSISSATAPIHNRPSAPPEPALKPQTSYPSALTTAEPTVQSPTSSPGALASQSGSMASARASVPTERSRSWVPLIVLALLVLLLALAGLWWLHNRQSLSSSTQGSSAVEPPGNTSQSAETERAFQTALVSAQAAQQSKDYSQALGHAEQALKLKPNDPAASALADEMRLLAQAAIVTQQKYQTATNAAALALVEMNYREATNQASIALALKPGDAVAARLLTDSQQALSAGSQQQQFQAALDAAKSALDAGQYDTAAVQAALALKLRPNDPAAVRLSSEVQLSLQNRAETSRKLSQYQQATNAAFVALGRRDYEEARRQAIKAMGLRTNDATALLLKDQAETGMALMTAQNAYAQGAYSQALALCQQHPGSEAFIRLGAVITAEQKALTDASLSLSNGDYRFIQTVNDGGYGNKPAFTNLLSQANREQDVLAALQSFRKTNGWQSVKERLADPALASVISKPPFAELLAWANAQAAVGSGDQSVQRLDADLEILLVQFRVFKSSAPEIHTEVARKTKPLPSGALDDPQFYLTRVAQIEKGYGDWLEKDNRRDYIKRVKEAINYR